MRAAGIEQLEELDRAGMYYQKCVEHFTGLDFFDSETNLRACRRRLDAIAEEQQRLDPESGLFDWFPVPIF
jgi:hypothetical protein